MLALLLVTAGTLLEFPSPQPMRVQQSMVWQTSMKNIETEILRLENARVQAMIQRDYATLEWLMAPECVHIESNGTIRTTAEFMANFKADDFTFDEFVIDENRARIYGTTAVVTGRYHNSVRTKGEVQPIKYAVHTRVWSRQAEGSWKMVSHQATEIPAD